MTERKGAKSRTLSSIKLNKRHNPRTVVDLKGRLQKIPRALSNASDDVSHYKRDKHVSAVHLQAGASSRCVSSTPPRLLGGFSKIRTLPFLASLAYPRVVCFGFFFFKLGTPPPVLFLTCCGISSIRRLRRPGGTALAPSSRPMFVKVTRCILIASFRTS